jgi:manganese-dependent inorganic pyrophosphatase
MVKTVYIIGHRTPDTESVVSAAAYAALKQAGGQRRVIAARAERSSPRRNIAFFAFFKAQGPLKKAAARVILGICRS